MSLSSSGSCRSPQAAERRYLLPPTLASSPSHGRRSVPSTQLDSSMFHAYSKGDSVDGNSPSTDCEAAFRSCCSSEVLRKLSEPERYHGQQLLRAFHVIVALAFSWTLFSAVIVNAKYVKSVKLPIGAALLSEQQKLHSEQEFGPLPPEAFMGPKLHQYTWGFRLEYPSTWFRNLHAFVDIFCGFLTFILFTVLAVSLSRSATIPVSKKQLFAGGMLVTVILYLNLHVDYGVLYSLLTRNLEAVWYSDLGVVFHYLSMLAVGPLLLFFVWATIHSYRIPDTSEEFGARFYLSKILMVVAYSAARFLPLALLNMYTSEMPLITFVVMWHHFRNFNIAQAYPKEFACVVVLTVVELVFIALIVREAALTMRYLRKMDDKNYGTEHLGFRFFMYITCVFFISHFLMLLVLALCRPTGNLFSSLLFSTMLFIVPDYHQVGCHLSYVGYAVIWALANLPRNAAG